jgi:hypothetical protein
VPFVEVSAREDGVRREGEGSDNQRSGLVQLERDDWKIAGLETSCKNKRKRNAPSRLRPIAWAI